MAPPTYSLKSPTLRPTTILTGLFYMFVLLMAVFPFDFARFWLGSLYVPWAALLFLGLTLLLLCTLLLLDKPLHYDRLALYGSVGFMSGLLLPVAFGRALTPMVVELAFYLIIPLVIFNIVTQPRILRRTTALLIVIGTALSLWGLSRIALGKAQSFSFGPPGALGTRNSAAFIIEGVYFLALSAAMFGKHEVRSPWRFASGVAAVLMLIAVVLSFSRGAWISMAVGYLGILATMPRRTVSLILKSMILASIAVGITFYSFPYLAEGVVPRASTIFAIDNATSNYSRWELIRESWNEILQDPFIGIGAGNFMKKVPVYNRAGTQLYAHPHNAYIYAWLEEGIIGFASFLLLLLAPLWGLWGQARSASGGQWVCRGFAGTMVAYTTHFLFAVFFNMMYFWVIYGLALATSHQFRKTVQS